MEENPAFWRTLYDELNNKVHVLTKDQIDLIMKIKNKAYINDTIKNKDYSYELPKNPFALNQAPVSKKSFMPSYNERIRVNKLVYAMKMGWLKP